MTDWHQVFRQIDARYPFLSSLRLSAEEDAAFDSLPDLLKLSIVSTSGIVSAPQNRVGMVFPCLNNTAVWIALGTTLAVIHSHFKNAATSLPLLRPGTKVKIDGVHVAILESETASGYRLRFHSGTITRRGPLHTWITIPKTERIRIQETETARSPSQFVGIPRPQKDFLDNLLCIETFGNRSLFNTCIILVTRIGQCCDLFHNTKVVSTQAALASHPSVAFSKLLQWGSLRIDGRLEDKSAGQIKATPSLLLAPDLLAVRAFLRGNPTIQPLIIMDGGETLARREGVLDEILDTGCSALACLAAHEVESIKVLSNSAFNFWTWSRRDLSDLLAVESKRQLQQPSGFFTGLRREYRNFARRNVASQVCNDVEIQSASEDVHTAVRALHTAEPGENHIEVEHGLYGCLLSLARCVRPFSQGESRIDTQIARLQNELSERQLWLPEAASIAATRAINTLCALRNAEPDQYNAKQRSLVGHLSRSLPMASE